MPVVQLAMSAANGGAAPYASERLRPRPLLGGDERLAAVPKECVATGDGEAAGGPGIRGLAQPRPRGLTTMQCGCRALPEGARTVVAGRLRFHLDTHWAGPTDRRQNSFSAAGGPEGRRLGAEQGIRRASRDTSEDVDLGRFFFVAFDHEVERSPSTLGPVASASTVPSDDQPSAGRACARSPRGCHGERRIRPTGKRWRLLARSESRKRCASHAAERQGPRGRTAAAITIAAPCPPGLSVRLPPGGADDEQIVVGDLSTLLAGVRVRSKATARARRASPAHRRFGRQITGSPSRVARHGVVCSDALDEPRRVIGRGRQPR